MSMRSVSVLGALLVFGLLFLVDAAPYQELEPRVGYIPVYIREGDTPLIEINPRLAEAFNEIDTQNLLEQVDASSEAEKKPDLILMSIDSEGDAMLITKPDDQVMSENHPAEVVLIVPTPVSEAEEEVVIPGIPHSNPIGNINEDTNKAENGKAGESETASTETQLGESKEVIKGLVNVLKEKIPNKLSLDVPKQTAVDDEKTAKKEENNQPQLQKEAEKLDDTKISNNGAGKPTEPATDVLTVDAFKTKEIDVKSIETEEIDVPEKDIAKDTTLSRIHE